MTVHSPKGRPSKIDQDAAAVLDRLDSPGLPIGVLKGRLEREGIYLSRSTLQRWRRSVRPEGRSVQTKQRQANEPNDPVQPGNDVTGISERAQEALDTADLGDGLRALHVSAREVARALRRWGPNLGDDARAVRAYSALIKVQKELSSAICELSPRPQAEKWVPLERSALRELVERAKGVAVDEVELVVARERIEAQKRIIDELLSKKTAPA
jgi:hypothetical protein